MVSGTVCLKEVQITQEEFKILAYFKKYKKMETTVAWEILFPFLFLKETDR